MKQHVPQAAVCSLKAMISAEFVSCLGHKSESLASG